MYIWLLDLTCGANTPHQQFIIFRIGKQNIDRRHSDSQQFLQSISHRLLIMGRTLKKKI